MLLSMVLFAAALNAPTFNKDVAPILYSNCVTCHRAGEVAPFPLITYQDAKRFAPSIAQVVGAHVMPPWKAAPGFGEFADARVLTEQQITTLKAWAAAGAPEGDAKDKPALPKFTDGWTLGPPDMVIEMPTATAVPADGNDIYRCFVIPMDLKDDMAIAAVEVRPGNRKVLHHTIIYTDRSTTHDGRARAAAEAGSSYTCYGGPGIPQAGMMGGWAPGSVVKRLEAGSAKVVPAGADLVIQNHYHPDGKPESDKTTIGVYLQKGAITQQFFSFPLIKRDLEIPAGEKNFRVTSSFTTPIDVLITSVAPHMHLLGREMKVTAKLPSGELKKLIWIQDWDFNWQGGYSFKEPMLMPKGTRFEVEAVYDNSSSNPRNPSNPPKTVSWGEATTDEMCIAFVGYKTPKASDYMTIMISLARQLDLMKYRDLTGGK